VEGRGGLRAGESLKESGEEGRASTFSVGGRLLSMLDAVKEGDVVNDSTVTVAARSRDDDETAVGKSDVE
jgi:hypothetical protein